MQEYLKKLEAAITSALGQALDETAPGLTPSERSSRISLMVAALSVTEAAAIALELVYSL